MIAKIIGYSIGGLFVLGLLGGPALMFYFMSIDTFEALSFDRTEVGKIVDCTSIRSSGNQVRYRRVPVVELADGLKVKGTVDEIRFIYKCDQQVGKEVEVLLSSTDSKKAKINSFLEMWFGPILSGLVCLIIYPVYVIGYIRKLKKKDIKST